MSFFIPKPKFPASGVGLVVLSSNGKKVYLVEGDRNLWPEGVKEAWDAIFHPVFEEAGKRLINGAPVQVITVTETLEFLGKTFGPVDQTEGILEWCVSKGYFPKCCFTREAAVEIAKRGDDYEYGSSQSQLLEFHAILMDFTARVADAHYLENVFGAVDGSPTMDVETIRDTLYREADEEFNLPRECLNNAQFLCYGEPRQARKTGATVVTAYFVVFVNEDFMVSAWQAKMLRDRPTGNEWRGALSWYKFLGVNLADAKRAKAALETGPRGGFYPVAVHPNMDSKNWQLIEMYVAMSTKGSAPPNPASQRTICWDEPATKRQRENPEDEGSAAGRLPDETPVPGSLDEFVAHTLARAKGSLGSKASAAISTKMRLHLMVNNGSVTPLLPQGDEPKLPSHPVPIGTVGEYMGERAVVTYYDETLPSQYALAGHECLLTVEWEGGRVRIPKMMFLREGTGLMWE